VSVPVERPEVLDPSVLTRRAAVSAASHHPSTQPWSREALAEGGFVGFVPFSELTTSEVPPAPGVYAVLRVSDAPPRFIGTSPAGRLKGKDPSVSVESLAKKWLNGPQVLYIGKATRTSAGPRGLQKRLDDFRRFGAGEPVNHPGGRYLWQLADAADLVVAWNATATSEDAATLEARMLRDFTEWYNALPFANRR
jgi:hypothetical protein